MHAICEDGCFADLRRRGPSSDATIDLAVGTGWCRRHPYRCADRKTSTSTTHSFIDTYHLGERVIRNPII